MTDNENIAKNGWSEYGRLVLKELERLNDGQDSLKRDLDLKFLELNTKMSDFRKTEKDVEDLKAWREKVTEVWSTSQMQQAKDELYKQKGQWQKTLGILIGVQVILGGIIALLNYIK